MHESSQRRFYGITLRITSHSSRHSFATHHLQINYDIRVIQKIWGHSILKRTMI
ncbi:MAG: hypothetical protein EHM79_13820 [Geobacter sp.]|nr:MAG: hypothetical protein EHM79_13820 [Geobacter sp.]